MRFLPASIGVNVVFDHKCGHEYPMLYASRGYAALDRKLMESQVCLECKQNEEIQRAKDEEKRFKSLERKEKAKLKPKKPKTEKQEQEN